MSDHIEQPGQRVHVAELVVIPEVKIEHGVVFITSFGGSSVGEGCVVDARISPASPDPS